MMLKRKSAAASRDDDEDVATAFKYTMNSYGIDYPVDALMKRMKKGDILIPSFDPDSSHKTNTPGFQRAYVWKKNQADRFIESLLLGLPVPSVFLAKQKNNTLLVLDGQQRLSTLLMYINGRFLDEPSFELENVDPQFKGRAYATLPEADRRRLDNAVIHTFIVEQEKPKGGMGGIYAMYERLNTGGTTLQPQEIRVALFNGPLIDLLRELNKRESWRVLCGGKGLKRLKDHEMILRFFALRDGASKYRRPMKEFLNTYCQSHMRVDAQRTMEMNRAFSSTSDAVLDVLGRKAFRLDGGAINTALADAVMVGVSSSIGAVNKRKAAARKAYVRLLSNPKFREAVTQSTADEENVKRRIEIAVAAFKTI